MNSDKKTAQRMRTLAALAHERKLARALDDLFAQFQRWQAGQLDAFELEEKVHVFHNKTAREIYSFHVHNKPPLIVASALLEGVLTREEAGELSPEAQRMLEALDAIRQEEP